MMVYGDIRRAINWPIIRLTLTIAISAFTFGYDLNWWGAMLAHPYFNLVFGETRLLLPSGASVVYLSATQQSLGASMTSLGAMLGGIVAPFCSGYLGYRWALCIAAFVMIVGSIVQITCSINGDRYSQMIAGKLIVNIGVGLNTVNIPVYLANCAPAAIRGAVLNTFTLIVALAAIAASATILGLAQEMTAKAWLVPIGIQLATPVVTIATIFLIPENPQWLIGQGRVQEAEMVYRSLNPHYTDLQISTTVTMTKKATEESKGSLLRSLKAMWQGPDLKRTLAVIGIYCLYTTQGLNFLLSYLAVLMVQVGLPDPFKILVIIYVIVTVICIAAMFYQDTAGRRRAMLWGAALMFVCMFAFAGLFTAVPQPQGGTATAAIAIIMLWFVSFGATWYTLGYAAAAEIASIPLRSITITVGNFCGGIVNLLILFVSPYIQNPEYGNLGPKIGYIFGGLSAIAFVFTYLLVPELQGRSLVEVDYMYHHRIPIRKMKAFKVDSLDMADELTDHSTNQTAEIDSKEDIAMVEQIETARHAVAA